MKCDFDISNNIVYKSPPQDNAGSKSPLWGQHSLSKNPEPPTPQYQICHLLNFTENHNIFYCLKRFISELQETRLICDG